MAQRKRSRGNRPTSKKQGQEKSSARRSDEARRAKKATVKAGWEQFATPPHLVFYLVIISLVTYANAWPNSLTLDDGVFAASGRYENLGLKEIRQFFTEGLWSASGLDSVLYRPLLLLSIALEAQIFGDWAAGHHLVNIFLHMVTTVLVYGFVNHLLLLTKNPPATARMAAFLAAIIFAVHPIHAEVVNSIFNRSEMLVTIGVVGGLWWFLISREIRPTRAWAGLAVIYILVLLCRESGASLPALAVAMLWLTRSEPWQKRIRLCLPVFWLLIPLGIYLLMRTHALGGGPDDGGAGGEILARQEKQGGGLEKMGVTLGPEKLFHAVKLWFESIKSLLWPYPLQIYYDIPRNSFWLSLAVQLGLIVTAFITFTRKRYGLILGLAFFYISLLPSSRIIAEVATNQMPVLADRLLYLPSVGLSIVLAFGFERLSRRFSPRALVMSVLAITIIMTPVTWARNAEWASDVVLFESDYRKLKNKNVILMTLIAAHIGEGSMKRAAEICDTHRNVLHRLTIVSTRCGFAYGHVGRYDDAEEAFFNGINKAEPAVDAHFQLAILYIHLKRKVDAEKHFELAVTAEKYEFMKHYRKAMGLIQLYPTYRPKLLAARAELEQALELQPQHAISREALQALNERINIADRRSN